MMLKSKKRLIIFAIKAFIPACSFLLVTLFCPFSWADLEQGLIRRIAVFPLKVESDFSQSAEEAWWQVREELTKNQRFLVASKSFLLKKDVFQARGELSAADALILTKLLDANSVITIYLDGRDLHMKAYESTRGQLVWEHMVRLHPSLPVHQQLVATSKKMIQDFIASIPYQGFVIKSREHQDIVYTREGKYFTLVEFGSGGSLDVGDAVQFVQIHADSYRPLFIDGATVEVFAEGTISRVNGHTIEVEVNRATSLENIQANSLVRFPKEFKRLQEQYSIAENLKDRLDHRYLNLEMNSVTHKKEDVKPLVTALTFIGNLSIFLLLAL